jgi:hypothetical protein
MAYTKDGIVSMFQTISPSERKAPKERQLPGGFPLVGLTVLVEFAKPLADVMRNYICHDRLQNCE